MDNSTVEAVIKEIETTSKEKKIDPEVIKGFLIEAIKRIYTKKTDLKNLEFDIDLKNRKIISNVVYEVVSKDDNDYDDYFQIPEDDERIYKKDLKIGDTYYEPFDIQTRFTRGEVLQILQSFKQKIIEVVNQQVYNSWLPKINQVIIAEFESEDKKNGAYYINLSDIELNTKEQLMKTTGFLPKKEQNNKDRLKLGHKYPFVVKEVVEQSKFWPVVLSRTSDELIKYYMQVEIPEIDQQLITITKIARSAGNKTKILVKSTSNQITEPAAICIGKNGARIRVISSLIGNERIEIYEDYSNPIDNLISLVERDNIIGLSFTYDETNTKIMSSIVFVKDDVVSVVLGKGGVNIKLINKLLGFNIDIKTVDYAIENEIQYTPIEEFKEIVSVNQVEKNLVEFEFDDTEFHDDNIEEHNYDSKSVMDALIETELEELSDEAIPGDFYEEIPDEQDFVNSEFDEELKDLINKNE